MKIPELALLALGLSMDAFAVAVCKGLAFGKWQWKRALIVAAWFGGFQMLMPALGYFFGMQLSGYIKAFDHWFALVLLAGIGINMIRESRKKDDEEANSEKAAALGFKIMLGLAVATSIDALAVGISFAFLSVNLLVAIPLIGATTFVISALGAATGGVFGAKYESGAELAGGVVLILIGIKIVLEHLGVINF